MTNCQYLKLGGCRRGALKRSSVLLPCSPSVLLSFCLVLVYLFSLARDSHGVSLGGSGQGEMVQPLPQGEEDDEQTRLAVDAPTAVSSSRVKRSRDAQQQLCGYRLLDALRNVCDRNFVAFTRRSDPSFLGSYIAGDGANDAQSSEDIFIGSNINPWESSSSSSAGDVLLASNSFNRDGSSILDYLELLPQQPVVLPPMVTSSSQFPWSTTRSNGGPGSARSPVSASSKAFALKMLAEPPKTHQRFRRNIIDECCKKPCAMHQMLKYCAITAVGKRSY